VDEPLNASKPDHVPLRPNGQTVHVVARLVYEDREEWRPAQTCRWTDTHVLAQWWRDDGTEDLCWLAVDDVRRAIVVDRDQLTQDTAAS